MNPFRKIAIQFNAKVTSFINDIENHEAVADAIIVDMKRSFASARVSLNQVSVRHEQLKRELAKCDLEIGKWQARAISLRETDHERALNCTKRMDMAEKRAEQIKQQVNEYSSLKDQMTRDLELMKERLDQVQLKKHELSGRQRIAKMKNNINGPAISEWSDQFEKWEAKVIEVETGSEPFVSADSFEEEFNQAESREELELKLKELK